jgi:glutamate racemase
MNPSALVEERGASWLVPLIERGALARDTVARELDPVLTDLRLQGIDVLILGCTHFPLVREIFEDGVGPGVSVVDSAETTAAEVCRVLDAFQLRSSGPALHRLLVTGPAEAFAERAQAMFHASPVIETVDLSLDPVS